MGAQCCNISPTPIELQTPFDIIPECQVQTQTAPIELTQEMEKSAIKIQTRYRGTKARKEVQKRRESIKSPIDRAKYYAKPIELINPRVRHAIEQFGEYNYDSLEPIAGCLTQQPREMKNKAVYTGQWKDRKRWGKGKQVWQDGSMYDGQWVNDMCHGHGRLIYASGDVYIGHWKEDKCHGEGTYYHSDGSKYEGEWVDDKQHGQGRETWIDSAVYEGDYSQGLKHGFGKFKWNDGSFYEGQYKKGNIEGNGTYFWPDGKYYQGQWLDNKMHGEGVFYWNDGKKYKGIIIHHKGQYKYDKKEGYGEFYWPDGRVYKGQWNNGLQHGEGVLIDKNGQEIKGFWYEGQKM